ncbi:MAG: hypothetical protein IPN02_17490 [Candidatus Microthrix sp.]|uniref:Phosphotyrosine protein phosphatase I domain-containing protein n=1 Tax=Candidatus Neomicrothrix subdominans TaxID=2954438 RepID=A0A936NGL6_9ACTN|nr:hypothetical protein [Candidatus Microthrix subdominans]
MAEHLARRSLEQRQIPAKVVSAGRLKGNLGATPGAVEAMARRKLDLSNHVSAQLSPEVLADAHLVLVMERGHLSDVYQTLPEAIDHAFTLGEFPSLLRATKADPSLESAATPLEGAHRRIALAHQARDPVRILVDDESSDIADPMGRWAWHYRRTAKQLSSLIDASLDGLFP